MCGRFYYGENIDVTPYVDILNRQYDQTILNLWQKGEIFPEQVCLTLNENQQPALMRWHYEISGHKIINTRCESLTRQSQYRQDFADHRCLVIASGFYEWDAAKQRYLIALDGQPLYLAAIYQPADPLAGFSILTRPADCTSHIHSRCPVVLAESQTALYLTDTHSAAGLIDSSRPQLQITPCGPQNMSLF